MIQIERVDHVPIPFLLNLLPYSAKEVEVADLRSHILAPGIDLWHVMEDGRSLALVGVGKPAFIGAASVQFLFGRDYGAKHLRRTKMFVRHLISMYGVLHAHVEDGFLRGRRFAEFAGFARTESHVRMYGHTYTLYEAR